MNAEGASLSSASEAERANEEAKGNKKSISSTKMTHGSGCNAITSLRRDWKASARAPGLRERSEA